MEKFKRDDYYIILQIEENASEEEIKSNFKKLKRKYHPDKYQDPLDKQKYNNRFILIKEAYDILSNETERKEYDLFLLKKNKKENTKEQNNIFNDEFLNDNNVHLDLEAFFNKIKSKESPEIYKNKIIVEELLKNQDFCFLDTTQEELFIQNFYQYTKNKKPDPYIYEINLTTDEMKKGTVHVLNYKISRICPFCKGNFAQKCSCCRNQRLVIVDKEIYLRFPENTQLNDKFTIKSKGYSTPYRKGIGDLIIKIKHFDINWRKEGNNYVLKHKISKEFAKNGGLSEIKYLNNKTIVVNLPKNLRNKHRLILKNKGFLDRNGDPTDLILEIRIKNYFLNLKNVFFFFLFCLFLLTGFTLFH